MANITVNPSGNIYLVKTGLEKDYKNTFTFSSLSNQTSYFDNLSSKLLVGNDYSYVKENNKIRAGVNIDSIINYNYLFYENEGFTTKRYYCFIDKMEYVNENCTDIYIQTDVFQTWYFDIVWNRCFVEREHVNDDTVGLHTVPEGLETGDFIVASSVKDSSNDYFNYILQATCANDDTFSEETPIPFTGGGVYNGIYGGGKLYREDSNSSLVMNGWLQSYSNNGTGNAIISVFIAPSWLSPQETGNQFHVKESDDPITYDITLSKPANLNGYVPKNKKLLTGDYTYLIVSNNNGAANMYKFEYFIPTDGAASNEFKFQVAGAICPGCSIRTIPKGYKNIYLNNEEGINLGKFPVCSFPIDSYTNWLTQNSVNIAGASISKDEFNIGTGVASLATGAAIAAAGGVTVGGGMMLGGIMGVTNSLYATKQHNAITPSAMGNVNAGDVTFSMKNNCFTFYTMSIRAEYAKIIDDYLSMYGYKVNAIKIPNITGRTNWNFIKTIDCNVDGNIPENALQTIRDACNKGITFWHNPANIYRYDLSNNIIS